MSNSRMAREYAALYHRLVSAADADAPEVSASDAESMHHLPALKALKYSTPPPRAAQGPGKRKKEVVHLVLCSSVPCSVQFRIGGIRNSEITKWDLSLEPGQLSELLRLIPRPLRDP